MSEKLILQITGPMGAGKTEVCQHLVENHNFFKFSISDIIRQFATKNNIPLFLRNDLLTCYALMKQETGNDVISRSVAAIDSGRICVDGVRVINDAIRIKNMPNTTSKIIALSCPQELRWQRSKARNHILDPDEYAKFVEVDMGERFSPNPELQNLDAVIKLADYNIDSSVSLQEVKSSIDVVLDVEFKT